MKWPEIIFATKEGSRKGIAPAVISASRATDIPGCHARWLMHRLRAGYCGWQNPFNPKQIQYVSFARCKAIVFWSKNPRPLMQYLSELDDMGIDFYFQFTLNDYRQERLEPGIPALEKRIQTFKKLAMLIGSHRVIWRFDPIIMGASLTVPELLARIAHIAGELCGSTDKLVFSFLDMYAKTRASLGKIGLQLGAPDKRQMFDIASGIAEINSRLERPLTLQCCAEDIDLTSLGINRASCIDGVLLRELCRDGKVSDLPELPEQGSLIPSQAQGMKRDNGQRRLCGCHPARDIGAYDTCMHMCAYYYANHSREKVIRRVNAIKNDAEFLWLQK